MTILADNPTKAQELDHWRAFLASLPPCSYLALYFQESVPILEQAMRNDWSCEPISQIRRSQTEALMALDEILARKRKEADALEKLQRETATLRLAIGKLRDEFAEMSKATQTLARCAADSHARAVRANLDNSR
ncbi:MAG TPA: hypothetical protein VFE62_23485 [Gemmataceae bacterium]|nr:hypothetical protein [Gemmataceae bacterium]